jgi:tetratricopeptide (TPR) repeat protein
MKALLKSVCSAMASAIAGPVALKSVCSAALVAGCLSVLLLAQVGPERGGVTQREDAYRQNNIGVARLEQYDYAGAAAAFRRALEIHPDLAIARLNLAIALLYDGQLDEAARAVRAAAGRLPALPHPHFVLGLIARADNKPDEAAASFQQVIAIDGSDVGAHVQLGQVRLAERRFGDAGALFERALQLEPFNATAAYGLAQALTRGGERERGEAVMRRFQALRDNPAAITYSATYLEQGRYGEAVASTGLEPELVDREVPDVRFVDATRSMLPAIPDVRSASLSDIDNDGDIDLLLVRTDGVHVLKNTNARFSETAVVAVKSATAVVAADYDNDGAPDLFVLAERGASLHRQQANGTFRTADALPVVRTPARVAAFIDADHDGDADVIAGGQLLQNNGNGTFSDVTAAAKIATAGVPPIAVVPTDFDNRRDIDLLIVGDNVPPALMSNQRDGTFRDVAADVGLPPAARYTSVAAADINKDMASDFFLGRADARGVFVVSDRAGRFGAREAPPETVGTTAAQLVDYDNDGIVDLFALTRTGPRLWRGAGADWIDVTSRALPASLVPTGDSASALMVADFDGDGDEDTIARLASGAVRVWKNEGGNRARSLTVRLTARVSNRSALGAKVELRAGSLRQRIETSATTPAIAPADILFGLGPRAAADVVRVLWPAGIVQAETELATRREPSTRLASVAAITELDRKPSSCPFLYTWNGSRFEFVTDFMGGGEMGAWMAPGVRNVPDPDEYVRIRDDQLRVRNGRYEVRVTNELEEALFVDRLQLLAVDHPANVEVHPNEGLRSPERREPFTIYTSRGARPPRTAFDDHGHDVIDRIATRDRRYVDDFRVSPIQGYADRHALTIDTGAQPTDTRVLLLLTAWTDYAFSSDNVAARQAGLVFHPPELQAKDRSGNWYTVLPEIGLPVGRPQTVVIDVTPHTRRGLREFRIMTTLRVYWDEILVDRSEPVSVDVARLDAAAAHLRWRGFSLEYTPDGRAPFTYDYERVTALAPWKLMPGRYTREGDVLALLEATDDKFVVSAPGDEIAVSFDALSLPHLPPGRRRTFLLYVDGFSKEMNMHSSSPDVLDPLPFHGMSTYPYPVSERYPSTPEHERYRAEYNTRVIGRPLPPLEAALEGARARLLRRQTESSGHRP